MQPGSAGGVADSEEEQIVAALLTAQEAQPADESNVLLATRRPDLGAVVRLVGAAGLLVATGLASRSRTGVTPSVASTRSAGRSPRRRRT